MKNSLYSTCWIFALIALKVEAENTLPKLLIDSVVFKSQYFPAEASLIELIDTNNVNDVNYSDRDKVLLFESVLSYARLAFISQFPTAATSFNISDQCKYDSQTYFQSYNARKDWALRMHASSSKLPSAGVTETSSTERRSYGMFDECIDTRGPERPNTTDGSSFFNGKYCSVFFNVEIVQPEQLKEIIHPLQRDNLLFWWHNSSTDSKLLNNNPKVKDFEYDNRFLPGIDFCIPSSCSAMDFSRAVSEFVGQKIVYTDVDESNETSYYSILTYAGDDWCHTRESVDKSRHFDGPDIAIMVTLSLFVVLVLAASSYDAWRNNSERRIDAEREILFIRILHCFSLVRNGRELLSTKAHSNNLPCLNGLRIVSLCWVVLGHTLYIFDKTRIIYNYNNLKEKYLHWTMQGPTQTVSVDTFLLLSGLLVAYTLLRDLDRNEGKFNVFLFYLNRYIRLTPVYAIILGFLATLVVYTSSGPNWRLLHYMAEGCRWNWWSHFLYINNYYNPSPIKCMPETWYLACDMQMFIVSPLIVWPLWRWQRVGLVWVLMNIVAFTSGLIATYATNDLPPTLVGARESEKSKPHFWEPYNQMWNRFPPYLLGILIGWILHITKNKTITVNKYVAVCGWILATSLGLAVVYGLTPYLDETKVPVINQWVRVSYASLHRLSWSFAVGWVIFACIHGYGGPVNAFLSWKVFTSFSRLSYVVYLVHFNILHVYVYHLRKPFYYTDFNQIPFFLGILFCSFLFAFPVVLAIEFPMGNLLKLIAFNESFTTAGKTSNNAADITSNEKQMMNLEASTRHRSQSSG